jgi:hypothetical protein
VRLLSRDPKAVSMSEEPEQNPPPEELESSSDEPDTPKQFSRRELRSCGVAGLHYKSKNRQPDERVIT